MDIHPSMAAKLAATVLANCANVLHTAYTHGGSDKPAEFQPVFDNVRALAAGVTATVSFWGLHPLLPLPDDLVKASQSLVPVLRDAALTLDNLELLLVERGCSEPPHLHLGFEQFDLDLLIYKLKSYVKAITFVADMVKRAGPGHIDMTDLRRCGQGFQIGTDKLDDRGQTGVILLVEVVNIKDNLDHIEELVRGCRKSTNSRQQGLTLTLKGSNHAATDTLLAVDAKSDLAGYTSANSPGDYNTSSVPSTVNLQRSLDVDMTDASPLAETFPTQASILNQDSSLHLDTISTTEPTPTSQPSISDGDALWRAHAILPFRPAPPLSHNAELSPAFLAMGEGEQVANLISLIKWGDLVQAELRITALSNCKNFTVASKATLAECLYGAGETNQVIKLLQIPLNELQLDPTSGARVNHILAKTYFADGALNKAIDYCSTSVAIQKRVGTTHVSSMESTELMAQILIANGQAGEADTLRIGTFTGEQHEFLHQIDLLRDAMHISNYETRNIMVKILEQTMPKNSEITVDSLLARLGDMESWNFHVEILGFDGDFSLLALLAEMDNFDKLILLAIRGNVETPAPFQTRPALDTLLRTACSKQTEFSTEQTSRVATLLDLGADIEAGHSSGSEPGYSDLTTPLHLAVASNHVDVVKLLLDRGANVLAKTKDAKTPLDLALCHEDPLLAELLRQRQGI